MHVLQWLSYRENINFMVAILKFKMATPNRSKLPYTYFIVLLGPKNVSIDTKIRSLRASRAKIWSKVVILAAILKNALYRKS